MTDTTCENCRALQSEIQREAAIRFELEKLHAAAHFEARVIRLKGLIESGHKFEWPYTDAFDDGGHAYHEAKRRIEAGAVTA